MCLDYVASFPQFSEVQEEIESYMHAYDAKVAQVRGNSVMKVLLSSLISVFNNCGYSSMSFINLL